MSTPEDLPSATPVFLGERIAALTPDDVVRCALAIEEHRSDAQDAALLAHHRLAVPGLTTTPFMHHVGLVARDRGVFAFDRLERAFLPPAKPWVHLKFGAGYYAMRQRGDTIETNALWPFAQDCPVADFQLNVPPKWWSHGLVHTLVGFGWWPELSEWDVMHMARLSEALAAFHWYWLAELGRMGDDTPNVDLSDIQERDAPAYLDMELQARDPEVRLTRLRSQRCRDIAENGLGVLHYESFAFQFGMTHGMLVEPESRSLDFGEACEYAKIHLQRLRSPAFARWVERCLVADVDYATNHAAFDVRCSDVLAALLRPPASAHIRPDVRRERATRVLMDLGQRLCHLAALCERPVDGFEPELVAVADALSTLRDDRARAPDPDDVVAEVMARLARDIPQPAGGDGVGVRELLALGYAPTSDPAREPPIAKAARADALVRRAWALQPAVGASAEGLIPVVLHVIDQPRHQRLVQEMREAADPIARSGSIEYIDEVFLGWLEMASHYWGPPDGTGNMKQRWRYRLAWTELPDDCDLTELVAMPNPYLTHLPLMMSGRWFDDFLKRARGSIGQLRTRPLTAIEYCLVGPGRHKPVLQPITPEIGELLGRLEVPMRVDELIAGGISRERVARAVAGELILVFHKPVHKPPPIFKAPAAGGGWAVEPDAGLQTIADWNEPAQVEAYERFTARSRLYEESSRELVERAHVGGSQRVGDLGAGTGITTRAALARLGPEGRVVGVDPAERMVERVRALVDDARARFRVGTAEDLVYEALEHGHFARIVCNSAIWLTADIKREIGRVRGALADEGVFAFSMPAAFLGRAEHLQTPAVAELSRLVDEIRKELDFDFGGMQPTPVDPTLGSVDNMRLALENAAFRDVDFQLWDFRWPASEYLDWMTMPVIRDGMVPRDRKADSLRMIEMLRERLDPDLEFGNPYYMIIARARS